MRITIDKVAIHQISEYINTVHANTALLSITDQNVFLYNEITDEKVKLDGVLKVNIYHSDNVDVTIKNIQHYIDKLDVNFLPPILESIGKKMNQIKTFCESTTSLTKEI